MATHASQLLAATVFLFAVRLIAVAVPDDSHRAGTMQAPAITGLDHVPIAVLDLDRAAQRYRALGFSLKPGRPHANGIRNQHVKFPDGTEVELITAPAARDALTTKYRRHLAEGDGPAFLAFYAPALDAVAERLDAAEVKYRRTPALVDITDGQPLDYIFFGGRNKSPTDRPEHFAHANGAESLIGVWLAGDDLSPERTMLAALGAKLARRDIQAPEPVDADVAQLQEGEVVFLPGARQLVPDRRIVGVTIRVASVTNARTILGAIAADAQSSQSSIFLPPSIAYGLWLELREAR